MSCVHKYGNKYKVPTSIRHVERAGPAHIHRMQPIHRYCQGRIDPNVARIQQFLRFLLRRAVITTSIRKGKSPMRLRNGVVDFRCRRKPTKSRGHISHWRGRSGLMSVALLVVLVEKNPRVDCGGLWLAPQRNCVTWHGYEWYSILLTLHFSHVTQHTFSSKIYKSVDVRVSNYNMFTRLAYS
jgi:hypothetical protein